MTKEENIATLNEHLDHWKRLLSEKICDQDEGEKTIDALQNAIKALKQEPCDDAVDRQVALDAMYELCDTGETLNENPWRDNPHIDAITDAINDLPSVTPQPKMGHWEWNQYDANPKIGNFHCSLCHSIGRTYFDYCPYCGAKMSEIPTGEESEG